MKVLHVVDAIDPSLGGGTAERTFQLAIALRRAGISCSVLCTDVGLSERRKAELDGVELVAVPAFFRRFLIPMVSSKRIESLVGGADIVHVTGHWSVLGARVCMAARRLGKPYVYCPAGSLRIFGRSKWLKKLYNLIVGKKNVVEASCCLAVTELEREQFCEYGVSDAQVHLLPNGVHPDVGVVGVPQRFRDCCGLGDDKVVLFLGRLSPIKGPDLLLDAFSIVATQQDKVQLVFAGPDAELGGALKAKTAEMGLSGRVLFTGFLAGQDKQDALAAADLLVVPSRQEAMSLVALEAGLCRTPVLLTDQCGFDEVKSIGGGMVVSVDVQALANGMVEMLNYPDELRAKGERLCNFVLAGYTWDGLTQRISLLYNKLIFKL